MDDCVEKFMRNLEFNETINETKDVIVHLSKILKIYFDSLIAAGFSVDEALYLTAKYQEVLMNPAQS